MRKWLLGFPAFVLVSTASVAQADETVRLFATFNAEICTAHHECQIVDGAPEEFTIQLTGSGDTLSGEKKFTFPLRKMTVKTRVSIEKSGGLYSVRVVISDTVKNQVKGDLSIAVKSLEELNTFTLSGKALKQTSEGMLTETYGFTLSPTGED